MSSNRLMYDTCAYKKRLDESVGPLNYTLYPGKYENCSKCRLELGTVGGNNVSLFSGNLVDLESDLRGQTRGASLCPSKHYQPGCDSCEGNTNGIPCDLDSCKPQLQHLPSCQMVRYPPTVPTPDSNVGSCKYGSKRSKKNRKKK